MTEGDNVKKKGVDKMEEFLKNSTPNGVVMNGLLLWIDIQRKTTAENVWKNQLLKKVTAVEITAAKSALIEVVDENIVTQTKIKKRQGENKSVNEIEDIVSVINKLEEANDLPVFLASSEMVISMPVLSSVNTKEVDISDVMNNVKMLEESMNCFMQQQKAQVDKLTETVNKPATHASRFMQHPQNNSELRSPSKRKRGETENGDNVSIPTSNDNIDQREHEQNASTWATVASKNVSKKTDQPKKQYNWRNKLNLFTGGNAKENENDSNENTEFAVDVNLVAYGVSKNASGDKLKEFMENKGLNIINCELLTKAEEARTNSFKITIKAKDFEKAKNREIWPYRVGVRHFRHFSTRPRKEEGKRPVLEDRRRPTTANPPMNFRTPNPYSPLASPSVNSIF